MIRLTVLLKKIYLIFNMMKHLFQLCRTSSLFSDQRNYDKNRLWWTYGVNRYVLEMFVNLTNTIIILFFF